MMGLVALEKAEHEYHVAVNTLIRTGVIVRLPGVDSWGVLGSDGLEYPVPSLEQVEQLVAYNQEIISRKMSQGFDRLALIPMAAPLPTLFGLLNNALVSHTAEGKVFQTRRSTSEDHVHVRVSTEKQVWIWDTLRQAIDDDALVYFPQQYSANHRGHSKSSVIHDERICAVPGWSIGLVESTPIMPGPGQGKTVGGRKQLETGLSPTEYLQALKVEGYEGESGKTLEDFVTAFLVRLETTDEVSHDVDDGNALWCLGQYLKIAYADVVPTGRWVRSVGRVRLDAHRTKNKRCTKCWGASTMVRLGM
ncbi:MAG: hypothetical protein ACYCZF_16545 [Anaerolineae bacterium]